MNGINILVDTNVLIYLFSGNEQILDFLEDKSLSASIITEIEVLSFPDLKSKEENSIKDFFKKIEVIHVNNEVKELAIQIKRSYKIKLPDAIIAASSFYKISPVHCR